MTEDKTKTKHIDYLREDDIIPNQRYVCISFISPEGIKNCSIRGLKIRGVFPTKEEADKRAEELQKIDPDFDIYVGEVGKWLPWDPDPNSIKDAVYQEKELNDLVKGYKENQEKAKKMLEQRKEDAIRNAAHYEQNRVDKIKSRLRKKLETKRNQQQQQQQNNDNIHNQTNKIEQKSKLEQEEKELKETKKIISEKQRNLKEVEKCVNENERILETIDDKLAKIQKLYDELNKKQK